jgi:hypothetical protein
MKRLAGANKVVLTNREYPLDFINIKVEERVSDRPFDNLDRYITQDELQVLSKNYKRVTGSALGDGGRKLDTQRTLQSIVTFLTHI